MRPRRRSIRKKTILFSHTYDADSFTGRRREAAMEGISFDFTVVLTGDSPRLDFERDLPCFARCR